MTQKRDSILNNGEYFREKVECADSVSMFNHQRVYDPWEVMLRKADLKETLSERELAAVPKTVTYNEMGPPDAKIASQTFLKHA